MMGINKLINVSREVVLAIGLEPKLSHAFAVALGEYSGWDYSINIGVRSDYSDSGEHIRDVFTYATTEINHMRYDAQGLNADNRWEQSWEQENSSRGQISDFKWYTLESSPDFNDVVAFIESIKTKSGEKLVCEKDFSYDAFKKNLIHTVENNAVKKSISNMAFG